MRLSCRKAAQVSARYERATRKCIKGMGVRPIYPSTLSRDDLDINVFTLQGLFVMLKFTSLVALAMSVSLAQAGKRGLAWPWCAHSFVQLAWSFSMLTLSLDNSPLDPGVLNNGDGQVVAMYESSLVYFPTRS